MSKGKYKISMQQKAVIEELMDDGAWRNCREIAKHMGHDNKFTASSIAYWLKRKSGYGRYVMGIDETCPNNRRKIFRKVKAL
tara:strand:- start:1118 stop:1363 length:246 start_codon:yes stop_codon:yes gene_type:complete